MHPAGLAVSARLRSRGEPAAQPWELVLQDGDGGTVQVVADQVEVQIPALGRRSARLIRAATMSGSHGAMMPAAASRSRQVRAVRSASPV